MAFGATLVWQWSISPSPGEGVWPLEAAVGVMGVAKPGVLAKADVREGRCGCGFCRHSRSPAACSSVAAGAAAEAVAEAVAGVIGVVTAAAVLMGAVVVMIGALAAAPGRRAVSKPA